MISIGTANEKGTFIISCAFTDENDAEVVPTEVKWTLTDSRGNVINDREQISVESLDSTIEIVLTCNDLSLLTNEKASTIERLFTIEATYDSSLGDSLCLTDEVKFKINNLKYIK